MKYTFDPAEVTRGLEKLAPEVFAIRALDCRQFGKWRSGTLEGFYTRDHIPAVLSALQSIEYAMGVYFTPNSLKPDVLARSCNRVQMVEGKKSFSACDHEVARRKWLLIDVDSIRTAGISATDGEKEAAIRTITDIDHHLWSLGFPRGVFVDSGNGGHLYIPIDLPPEEGGVVKGLLKRLAAEFDNETCRVDTGVFNPARIMRLPGTMAAKGDHVPLIGRPWRIARILRDCRENN